MPHWCDTSYIAIGDKGELDNLYETMRDLQQGPSLVKNDFGPTWLGNLITKLGGQWETIECRGELTWVERYDDSVHFDTLTAWSDTPEVIKFLKGKFPSLQFYFQATEPGCEYFVTNDKEGRFYLPYVIVYCCEFNEYASTEEFLKEIKELVDHPDPISSITEAEQLVASYNRQHIDDQIEIRIYKIIT